MTARTGLDRARTFAIALLALGATSIPAAQALRLLQATPLRAEQRATAEVRAQLAAGQTIERLQLRSGWGQVQVTGSPATVPGQRGWVRASAIDMAAMEAGAAAHTDTGRLAAASAAVPLGIRALPARQTRHALIVGVGQYHADPARPVAPLAGVSHDMQSALAIAQRLQVPAENIVLLRDAAATQDAIGQALGELEARVQPGDRVFIYWSGHGSRYFDAAEGGCVEALVPYDLRDISNRQFARWIEPIGRKVDKLLVMVDAFHSGGMSRAPASAVRAMGAVWTPKAVAAADARCEQPSNMRSLSFERATRSVGIDSQDIAQVSSARPDEVSYDHSQTGGLATYALRQCLFGEAVDADGSGAITIAELAACAQPRIEAALAAHPQLRPNHLTLAGNPGFVPAWFAAAPPPPALSANAAAAAKPPAAVRDVLTQIHAQRSSRRRVDVIPSSETLRIGQDSLDLAITSSHDGYLYIAMLGSDQRSLYLLFPNALDRANRIAGGQTLMLPRRDWQVAAGGPAGEDTLLVMVADAPRDLAALSGAQAGPFMMPLTDAAGRSRLQGLLGRCAGGEGQDCTDAFGSALLTLRER